MSSGFLHQIGEEALAQARTVDPNLSFEPFRAEFSVPVELVEAIVQRVRAEVLAELRAERPASPYLTIPEAATYLRCKRARVDDLLSQRRLTRYKDGSRTLVLRSEVEAHLGGVAHPLPTRSQTRIRRAV